MPAEITMPQLSDTMTEGTVVKWLKKEGDRVKAGEVIAEVETDKATMEMVAFDAGTIAAIVVPEGGKVAVGEKIAVLAAAGEDAAALKKQYAAGGGTPAAAPSAKAADATAPSAGQVQTPAPMARATEGAAGRDRVPPPARESGAVATMEAASNSEVHEPDAVGHGATRSAATAVPPVPGHGGNGNGHGDASGGRVFASPLARRIAQDKDIDLATLKGSGPGGRIVQADVLSAQAKPAAAAPAPREPAVSTAGPAKDAPKPQAATLPQRIGSGEKQVIPLTKMRATIAQRLQQSKQQVPHFYETIDVDGEALSALRERLNKQLEKEKVKLSVSDLVNKGVAVALQQHPALNAHFKGDAVTRFGDVHLGIAVSIQDGLIVPVLRNIHQMGFREIRQRSVDLAGRAREQRLKQDEMTGATFTVSTLGVYGIREFDAIINPPEVGILAVGALEPRAVVRDGQVVARQTMSLTLSVDHRAVDGATAADFLRTLKNLLEEPALMLV